LVSGARERSQPSNAQPITGAAGKRVERFVDQTFVNAGGATTALKKRESGERTKFITLWTTEKKNDRKRKFRTKTK